MPEPNPAWSAARLIPTAGKQSSHEAEVRASSALLAILGAVPTFSRGLLRPVGAPGGKNIETFTEVILKTASGDTLRPDGVILATYGSRSWGCLVEVKTGRAELTARQVEGYVRLARKYGFDAVLTISNQLRAREDELPYNLSRKVQGKIAVHHLSWWRIFTEAVRCQGEQRIDDPDQAWLLGELIRYLDDERSGCAALEGMGSSWVKVRDGIRAQSLRRKDDPGLIEVVERWEELAEYACLLLSQELGSDVTQRLKPDADARRRRAAQMALDDGKLRAEIRIKDAAGPMVLEADLRSGQARVATRIDAPATGQARGRIGWMLRQLKEAPGGLRIEVSYERIQRTHATTLAKAVEDPELLRFPEDRLRPPRQFKLSVVQQMGRGGGRGKSMFVDKTIALVMKFYGETLQGIRAWQASPPRLSEDEEGDDGA
jgi:hypothetical protein